LIGLPQVADELYRTARVLRLFTSQERRTVEPRVLEGLARLTESEARELIASDRTVLNV
jgi:hypothetical protein